MTTVRTKVRTSSPRTRLPLATYILALTVFCLGTSEFMLAGLLPEVAHDLGATIPSAGLLISGFAIGMLVGAPVMTLLTLRLPRKVTMIGAAVTFAIMHLLGAWADDFALLMITRVVAAVACATFWAVAAVTLVAIASPGTTARALGALVGGLTLANIIGVPLGTWIGQSRGWQAAFLAVAVVTVLATAATVRWVPETGLRQRSAEDAPSTRDVLRAELRGLTNGRLWLALATTATFQAAILATFSYLTPLLTDVSGLRPSFVPVVLLLFGIGSFVGITVGGRFADRNLLGNVIISIIATIIVLLVLRLVAPFGLVVVVAAFALGATSFSMASALNGRVFVHAGSAPTLASAVNVSAFNVGNAIGPWLGGLVISAGLGFLAPIWVSVGLTVVALGIAATSWRIERRPPLATRSGTGPDQQQDQSLGQPDASACGVTPCQG